MLRDVRQHQQRHDTARLATAPERQRLTRDLHLVDDALARTLVERVLDTAARPSPWHQDLLGPVPANPAARAVWCDAAYRLEAHLDRDPRRRVGWQWLCGELADTQQRCALAAHLGLTAPDSADPAVWSHVAHHLVVRVAEIEASTAGRTQRREHGLDLDW
jgi:hypothetical protein